MVVGLYGLSGVGSGGDSIGVSIGFGAGMIIGSGSFSGV
jgi:hypothetical protein